MRDLSRLLQNIPPSATVAVSDKARRLKAAGRDVIALAGGDPDFPTPRHIMDAAVEALYAGDTNYPPAKGTPAIVEAIIAKLDRENNVQATPSQIIVTPGGKWALYLSLAAITNPGDEVLILDPSWVSYGPMVELVGATPVRVTLSSAANFRITEDLLGSYVTANSKLLMVNSPNNPTGRVLTRDEINAIVRIATRHDLYVLSDEIYEHLLYDGAEHISLASESGMAERTIIVNGFSKAYAMTGWRLGWLAAPELVAGLAMKLQSQAVTSAGSFAMAGGVAALNGPQDCVQEMLASYAERRRFMVDALNEMPGIECAPIEGAFYLFPKFTNTNLNSTELADALLESADIAATPGIAFGEAGESHLRFSIATAKTDLERSVDRLARFVPTL